MDPGMLLEIAVRREGLVAPVALVGSHPGMLPLVDGQVHPRVIPLLAACIGTHEAVCPDLHLF